VNKRSRKRQGLQRARCQIVPNNKQTAAGAERHGLPIADGGTTEQRLRRSVKSTSAVRKIIVSMKTTLPPICIGGSVRSGPAKRFAHPD
jgi:hypothetical protein